MNELLTNPLTWINWFAPIALMALAKPAYKIFISSLKKYGRGLRLKELKSIKKLRNNPYEIYAQISKTSSYFTLFLISIALFFIEISTTQLGVLIKSNVFYFFLEMIPVLFFEILWLKQDGFTKLLIKRAPRIKR